MSDLHIQQVHPWENDDDNSAHFDSLPATSPNHASTTVLAEMSMIRQTAGGWGTDTSLADTLKCLDIYMKSIDTSMRGRKHALGGVFK